MYVERRINPPKLLEKKSHFLFGPRQTGKTALIRQTIEGAAFFDLLDSDTYLRLVERPRYLRETIPEDAAWVVIDEIQRIPQLLGEVQALIEERGIKFLLTGSSARKLRRGGVNLLGGRARSRQLHPLVWWELKGHGFDIMKALDRGTLPSIYFSDAPAEDLAAYVDDYLRHEISAEGLTRNLPAFTRFLDVAAATNGEILNYSNVSRDAMVPHTTVTEYFSILRDTLIGFELPAWRASRKRKATATSKFYFFDGGVARYLQRRGRLQPRSPDFGSAFEAWVHHELRSFVDYHPPGSLHYWRSVSKLEVDFILNEVVAVEVKAKDAVAKKDLKGLLALMEEDLCRRYCVVSFEPRRRRLEGVEIYPWWEFLEDLYAGRLTS